MNKKYIAIGTIAVIAIILAVGINWYLRGDAFLVQPPSDIRYEEKLAACRVIPNGSTREVVETTRLFINLPKDAYPDKERNLQFKTVSGNATAGWISNAGLPGEAFEATPECWSYYYEFDGNGEVNLTVKSRTKGVPDYFVRFIVRPTQ